MPAGDVVEERADRGRRRRRRELRAEPLGGCEAAGDQADRRALDIAFAAGDLAGEAQARPAFSRRRPSSSRGELRKVLRCRPPSRANSALLEAGDQAEHARLLAIFQLGLEADHVEKRAERIVLPQLHDGVGLHARRMRVGEADRLHRTVAQGLAAALGHHLDRQAAVEIGRALEFAEFGLFRGEQRVDEGLVSLAAHRAVDVVGARAAGPRLVVARLPPGDAHVDRIEMHDRRDRVEEGERAFAGEATIASARAGEVSGPVAMITLSQSSGGSPATSPRSIVISGSARIAASTASAKPSRSTASAPPAGTWFASAQRMISEPSARISRWITPTALLRASSERNEFEQTSSARRRSLVRLGAAQRAHLVQDDGNAGARDLPGGLRTRQTPADDVDGTHARLVTQARPAASRQISHRGIL